MQKFTEDQKDFLRILSEYEVSGNIGKCISDIDANILKNTFCTAILMLTDLVVYHYLDATTIIELYQMM